MLASKVEVTTEYRAEEAASETPIIDLVKANNYEGLKNFIAELERDIRVGKLGNVRELIANCVNERDASSDTSLHHITTSFTNLSTSVKIMNLLIAKGADVDALERNQKSPINLAVMRFASLACGIHHGSADYNPENTSKLLPDLASGKIPLPADLLYALKVHMGLLIKAGCNIGDFTKFGLTTFQLMSSYAPAEVRATISKDSLRQTYEKYMEKNHLQEYDFQYKKAGNSCIIL